MGKVSQKKIKRGLIADDIDLNDGVNSFGGKYAVNNADTDGGKGAPAKMTGSPLYGKISSACKAAAKRKFKVWPSAYASGWGVRCTKAGGPSKFGGGKKK